LSNGIVPLLKRIDVVEDDSMNYTVCFILYLYLFYVLTGLRFPYILYGVVNMFPFNVNESNTPIMTVYSIDPDYI
jgi:hypothetical protein